LTYLSYNSCKNYYKTGDFFSFHFLFIISITDLGAGLFWLQELSLLLSCLCNTPLTFSAVGFVLIEQPRLLLNVLAIYMIVFIIQITSYSSSSLSYDTSFSVSERSGKRFSARSFVFLQRPLAIFFSTLVRFSFGASLVVCVLTFHRTVEMCSV